MGQREQASSPINRDALRLIRAGFADSGMTQEVLSQASGVPRSTLANMLSPTADPRLVHVAQLVQIAIALEIDLRGWVAELEALERRRRAGRGDDLAPRRRTAQPQRRAARTRSGPPTLGEE